MKCYFVKNAFIKYLSGFLYSILNTIAGLCSIKTNWQVSKERFVLIFMNNN